MVYRALEASLAKPKVPTKPPLGGSFHNRLEGPNVGPRALGWSSDSIIGRVWSWRGRIVDFLSRLVPPWGFRHLVIVIVLCFGSILWMLHEDSKWYEYVALHTLTHPGEKFPTRDIHWRWQWTEFEIIIVFAPLLWEMCTAPFLRMALVCVDSFQSRSLGNPTEEKKLRRDIGRNKAKRLLALVQPAVIMILMAIFLYLTGYWRRPI